MNIQKQKGILALVVSLLGIPMAYASVYQTGISAINKAVGMISGLMTLPVLKNQIVQLGIIRFGLFLMVFSVAFWGLNRIQSFDRKPAGIVSFVLGFVGAALMPERWVYLNGSIFVVLVAGIVPIGMISLGIYLAMKVLVAGKNGEDWWKELAGLAVLLFLLTLISIYSTAISGGSLTYNKYPTTVGGQVGAAVDAKLNNVGNTKVDTVNVNIAGDVDASRKSLIDLGDDNSQTLDTGDTKILSNNKLTDTGDNIANIGTGDKSTTNTNSESTSTTNK